MGGMIWAACVQGAWAQKPFVQGARAIGRSGQALVSTQAAQLEKKILRKSAQVWTGKELVDGINPLRNSVFCARAAKGTEAFSGGVFETVYNGKKEVYGFIATHALTEEPHDRFEKEDAKYSLSRFFVLEMMDKEGVWRRIPAEVIQLSSINTLDISLVKFLPEHEKLFTPLPLSSHVPGVGDMVQSQGFSQNIEGYIPHRRVIEISPISLRTEMPWPREPRRGFCGGVVVNNKYELVGVHTGSVAGPTPQEDVAYATHAYFLNQLVDAYHRGGKTSIPLVLNGKKIFDLSVDESIEWASFYNKRGRKIKDYPFSLKFSFTSVEKFIREYQPRYIQFSIGRLAWSTKKTEFLERIPHTRRLVYDWEKGALIESLPAEN